MNMTILPKAIILTSILLNQSFAADSPQSSYCQDTWTLINDLPEKKQDASLGSCVPFMVLKSDSLNSPLKAVMLDVSVSNASVAKEFGIFYTAKVAAMTQPTIGINIMLRDRSQEFHLLYFLSSIKDFSVAVSINAPYPIRIDFEILDYSKIKDFFNELTTFFKISNTAKLALDQIYNDIEGRCISAGYGPETIKKSNHGFDMSCLI